MSFCVAWDICAYLQACLNRSEFTCEKNMGLCSPHFKAEKDACQTRYMDNISE